VAVGEAYTATVSVVGAGSGSALVRGYSVSPSIVAEVRAAPA
jgi:hypothetical protein